MPGMWDFQPSSDLGAVVDGEPGCSGHVFETDRFEMWEDIGAEVVKCGSTLIVTVPFC